MIFILLLPAHTQKIEGCTGQENPFSLIDSEPQLSRSTKNGKLFTYNYDGRKFYVASVKGTAYQMGLAYGQLFKQQLPVMIKQFYGWAAGYIQNNVSFIQSLPKFFRMGIGKSGVHLAKKLLDLNYIITKKYTPQRWNQEFQGVAKGAGVSIHDIRRINLIPQLLKASCSLGGWWGNATMDGGLLQLRALDWQQHAPIAKFPCITVYHPSQGSVSFANIAWIGFLGSLTGYSSAKIGIGQRLRGGSSDTMTRFGKPWTYVIRDTLQFSHNLYDALDQLNETERTCSIYLGVGSGHDNDFKLIQYSKTQLNIYGDQNWHVDSNHPRIPGMIWKAYIDGKPCFKNHFVPNYGKITAQLIYKYAVPRSQTGDSQVIVMDHKNDIVYAMYPNPITKSPGFQRPTIKIELGPRFKQIWE